MLGKTQEREVNKLKDATEEDLQRQDTPYGGKILLRMFSGKLEKIGDGNLSHRGNCDSTPRGLQRCGKALQKDICRLNYISLLYRLYWVRIVAAPG